MDLDQRLARCSLPLPLELEIRRALEQGELAVRHDALLKAWELAVAMQACAMLAVCRELGDSVELANAVGHLDRPGFADWIALTREAAKLLFPKSDAAADALGPLLDGLRSQISTTPESAALASRLRALELRDFPGTGERLFNLAEMVGSYSDECLHHTRIHPVFRAELAVVLLDALLCFCERARPLGDYQLTLVRRGRVQPERPYLRLEPDRLVALFPLAAATEVDGSWQVGWYAGRVDASTALFHTGSGSEFPVTLSAEEFQSIVGAPARESDEAFDVESEDSRRWHDERVQPLERIEVVPIVTREVHADAGTIATAPQAQPELAVAEPRAPARRRRMFERTLLGALSLLAVVAVFSWMRSQAAAERALEQQRQAEAALAGESQAKEAARIGQQQALDAKNESDAALAAESAAKDAARAAERLAIEDKSRVDATLAAEIRARETAKSGEQRAIEEQEQARLDAARIAEVSAKAARETALDAERLRAEKQRTETALDEALAIAQQLQLNEVRSLADRDPTRALAVLKTIDVRPESIAQAALIALRAAAHNPATTIHAGRACTATDLGGRLAAIGSDSGYVDVWLGTRHERERFSQTGISSLAWSENAFRLGVASADKRAWIWKLGGDDALMPLDALEAEVASLAWSADGSYLAAELQDGGVRAWRGSDGEPISLPSFDARCRALEWSPDSKLLLVHGIADEILVLDPAGEGERVLALLSTLAPRELNESDERVDRLATWSPDGSHLAFTDGGGVVSTWAARAETGEVPQAVGGRVTALQWCGGGAALLAVRGSNVVLRGAGPGFQLRFVAQAAGVEMPLCTSPTGAWLHGFTADGATLWRLDTRTGAFGTVQVSPEDRHECAWNADDSLVVVGAREGAVAVRAGDLTTVELASTGPEFGWSWATAHDVLFSYDGKRVHFRFFENRELVRHEALACASAVFETPAWSGATNDERSPFCLTREYGSQQARLWRNLRGDDLASLQVDLVTPQESRALMAIDGGVVALASNVFEGTWSWRIPSAGEPDPSIVEHFAWSPDSRTLVAGTTSGTIWSRRMDAESVLEWTEVPDQLPESARVRDLAWTPSGARLLIAGSRAGQAWFFDRDQLGEPFEIRDADLSNGESAWSPDGSCLATRNRVGTVKVLDLRTRANPKLDGEMYAADAASSDESRLWWSPDGRWLSYADGRHQLWLWNVTEPHATKLTRDGSRAAGDERRPWSSDSRALAWTETTEDGREAVRVWEREGGSVRDLELDGAACEALAWTEYGAHLAIADDRRRLQLFDASNWQRRTVAGEFDSAARLPRTPTNAGRVLAMTDNGADTDFETREFFEVDGRSATVTPLFGGHARWVCSGFDAQQTLAAVADSAGSVYLFDGSAPLRLVEPLSAERAGALSVSPDRRFVAVLFDDQPLRIDDLDRRTTRYVDRALEVEARDFATNLWSEDSRLLVLSEALVDPLSGEWLDTRGHTLSPDRNWIVHARGLELDVLPTPRQSSSLEDLRRLLDRITSVELRQDGTLASNLGALRPR